MALASNGTEDPFSLASWPALSARSGASGRSLGFRILGAHAECLTPINVRGNASYSEGISPPGICARARRRRKALESR